MSPPTAARSEHQQRNAIRLIHVCLATLMKAGLPRPAAMETAVAFSALREVLFHGALTTLLTLGVIDGCCPVYFTPRLPSQAGGVWAHVK